MTPKIYPLHATQLSVILLFIIRAQGAYIELDPPKFIEAVTVSVNILCSPDDTNLKATKILVMSITKDGDKPIVNMQPPDQITVAGDVNNRYETIGSISATNISDSFLNLTIKYPGSDDVGSYTCLLSYIEESGLVKQVTDNKQLSVIDTSNLDTDQRLQTLETALENLVDRVKTQEMVVHRLKSVNQNQSLQIEHLKEKVEYTVTFSAAISTETTISTGDQLVFGDVMSNEGYAYNSTTGEFTAPKSGLYIFHLVLEIGHGGAVGEILLRVSGKDVAKMYTQDKDFGSQGAITAVQRLNKDDVVSAHVLLADGPDPKVLAERLSVFSGFFLHE